MNYGKKNASKKQKKITSKTAKKKTQMGVRSFKVILIACLSVIAIGAIAGGILLKSIIDKSFCQRVFKRLTAFAHNNQF